MLGRTFPPLFSCSSSWKQTNSDITVLNTLCSFVTYVILQKKNVWGNEQQINIKQKQQHCTLSSQLANSKRRCNFWWYIITCTSLSVAFSKKDFPQSVWSTSLTFRQKRQGIHKPNENILIIRIQFNKDFMIKIGPGNVYISAVCLHFCSLM